MLRFIVEWFSWFVVALTVLLALASGKAFGA